MDPSSGIRRLTYKTFFLTVFLFSALVLLFTLVAVLFSPQPSQVGVTRPADTIPLHLLELAGFGLLLGAMLVVIYGREGLILVVLTPVLTVLLDLDHLPAYLGVAQTIRPAHSIVFIITVLAITAITIKRLEVDLVVLSATLAHMGIDTGTFAPFSPLSFDYYQLDPYRGLFLVGAAVTVLSGGFALRRRGFGAEPFRKEWTQDAAS